MKRHYLVDVAKKGAKWEASVTIGRKYFVAEDEAEDAAVESLKQEVYDHYFRDYITIDIEDEEENIKL